MMMSRHGICQKNCASVDLEAKNSRRRLNSALIKEFTNLCQNCIYAFKLGDHLSWWTQQRLTLMMSRMIMHSEIMNDRLKGFPSQVDVDEFAVMIMTIIMIVTIIMTKRLANDV